MNRTSKVDRAKINSIYSKLLRRNKNNT